MSNIPFSVSTQTNNEVALLKEYYEEFKTRRPFRKLAADYFKETFSLPHFSLTKSCTQSLELAMTIVDQGPRKEVIMPSYGFVSLANAVALRGFRCVFVDCQKGTMNICPDSLENAISKDTCAVITINYGGISCDYEHITHLCKLHNILLIEDNAHGIHAKYKDRNLGSIGDISTVSFDFLKNITCGEGGGISINNPAYLERFRMAFEFGTNKLDFLEGKTDHYEWSCLGSNNALAEQLSAILYAQLLESEQIIAEFLRKWLIYDKLLQDLCLEKKIETPLIPPDTTPNGHIYWIKAEDKEERKELMTFLASQGVNTAFHYPPLHSTSYGKKTGVFRGNDIHTTLESNRLLRLPMYYSLKDEELIFVVSKISEFYKIPFKY